MGDGAHGDHHRPLQLPCRTALDIRDVHGDVAVALDVPDADMGLEQRALEGEGAAQKEGDEVVPPVAPDVRRLVDAFPVLPDSVARDVRES